MRVGIAGDGFLASVMAEAIHKKGMIQGNYLNDSDMVLIAVEVDDHLNTGNVSRLLKKSCEKYLERVPIVITSQVPPGWMRPWGEKRRNVFYHPHMMRKGKELFDILNPSILIVGKNETDTETPPAFLEYLYRFSVPDNRRPLVPIANVSYETAEMAKLALSYMLAAQINAANELATAAMKVKADWEWIERYMAMDERIGPHAYITPGVPGGHLPRDVDTIKRILTI